MKNWFVKFIFNLFHYIIIQNCCFPKKEEVVEINDKTVEVGDKSNIIQCKIKEKINIIAKEQDLSRNINNVTAEEQKNENITKLKNVLKKKQIQIKIQTEKTKK